ncbi:glycosyltransferase [Pseudoroseicyclus sp. CXY001]|uniref:glycosyltransferase n=1 Tax=Pseudoroseicyclus sp. CXY001 TaxID=3242492 RepID=UPI00358DB8E9
MAADTPALADAPAGALTGAPPGALVQGAGQAGADLPELTVPVHFVAPERCHWPEMPAEGPARALPEEVLAGKCNAAVDPWTLRIFHDLRLHSSLVTLGSRTRADAINVSLLWDFGRKALRPGHFVVLTQSDGYPSPLADVLIRQNDVEPDGARSFHIPHTPQPGLVPRDPARGDRVEVLAFKGDRVNLDARFRSEGFLAELARRGVVLRTDFQAADGRQDWGDYSDVDCVLAVRDLTLADAANKPASKLTNAWMAGVPALLGPEPAFQSLRRDPLDYIEVRSPADVLAAIDRLQGEAGLYRRMVENGRARAVDYALPAVLTRWITLLNGPIAAAWARWKARPLALRAMDCAIKYLREGAARRDYLSYRDSGPRLLDGVPT